MCELYLVEPSIEHRDQALEYRDSFIVNGEKVINGSLGLIEYNDYDEWLEKVQLAHVKETSVSGVAATTYFTMRRSDNRIIGSIQLRHELNKEFRKRGGHIGYGIRPTERGRGYGTIQLALVLEKAKALNIPKVMISCDKDNISSATVAIKNGAVLTWEGYDEEDGDIKIFWINLR